MFKQMFLASILGVSSIAHANTTVSFDDLPLAPNSHYNGSDGAGGFVSGQAFFKNSYSQQYGAWQGFSYSNETDVVTAGYANEFSSFARGGSSANGSAIAGDNFALAFGYGPADAYFNVPGGTKVKDIRVTNTTLAAIDMRDGSPFGFSKKFGGTSGNDPDWFKITFTGYNQGNATGTVTGTKEFYLADFRFADNSQDYILNTWELVDLSGLLDAWSVAVTFSSSDNGSFGMNTPAYAALDNLTVVPEPAGIAALATVGFLLSRRTRR